MLRFLLYNTMKEDRIYIRIEAINNQLYDLEFCADEVASHKDYKEIQKRQSKLLKEKRKLQRRLKGIWFENDKESK
jgi:hypothetical protein